MDDSGCSLDFVVARFQLACRRWSDPPSAHLRTRSVDLQRGHRATSSCVTSKLIRLALR